MTWKIIAPTVGKESAKRLQLELNEDYPRTSEKIINWGNSTINRYDHSLVFGNKLEAVARSANKKTFFNLCKKHGTVPIFDKRAHTGGYFIHTNEFGSNGSGVVFTLNKEEAAQYHNNNYLVTKKVKGQEFRCYQAYGETISIFQKVKVEEVGDSTSSIHNSHNGWGYLSNPPLLRQVKGLSKVIKELTSSVMDELELYYGAVDFILDEKNYKVYVLESNSAPTLITNDLRANMARILASKYGER